MTTGRSQARCPLAAIGADPLELENETDAPLGEILGGGGTT